MNLPIPYATASLDDTDRQAVWDVLQPSSLTRGSVTQALEERLAELCKKKYCVVVGNGTLGLMAAVKTIQHWYENIPLVTSPLTFNAIANASKFAGTDLRFVDVDEDTLCGEFYNSMPASIFCQMDYAGYPSMLMDFATPYPVILDACHSLGLNPGWADIIVGSGHPVKVATGGEAGWVLTDVPDYYAELKQIRDNGRSNGQMVGYGLNMHLSQLNSALLLSQLKRLPQFLERRREIANRYYEAWRDDIRVVLPADHKDHVWHLFVLRLPGYNTFKFQEYLKTFGIITVKHYFPLHLMPVFGPSEVSLPIAEQAYTEILSIPMFYGLTDEQQEYVIETINRGLEECK